MKDLKQLEYLIVEDHETDFLILADLMYQLGIGDSQLYWYRSLEEIPDHNFDLAFCDLNLEASQRLETLNILQKRQPNLPIVALTGINELELAVQVIHSGAQDFLKKGGFDATQLYKSLVFSLERHSLRYELLDSRNEFEQIFESNPLPHLIYDLKTLKIQRVNKAAKKLYGYTAREFSALTIMDIRPESEKNATQMALSRYLKEGDIGPENFVHLTKDGRRLHVEVTIQDYQGKSGHSVIASVKDITEKIVAEEELKQSELRFECAARATSDIIYDWDLVNNRLEWKGKAISKFYADRGPLNIQQWMTLIHPEDRTAFTTINSNILSGEELQDEYETKYRIKNKNGDYSYVQDRATVLFNELNQPNRIIGAIEDITQQIETQKQLELSEKRYHLFFNESPVAKFLCKADDFELLQVNQHAKRIISSFHKPVKSFDQLFEQSGRRTIKKMVRNYLSTGQNNLGEWIIESRNYKGHRTLKLTMHMLDWDGQKQILFAGSDVTELEETRFSLQDYVERYKLALQATKDSIWDYDFESGKLKWADNFTATFGLKPDNIADVKLWEANIHPNDRKTVVESFDTAIANKKTSWEAHYRFRKGDESYAHVFDQCTIVYNEKGQPLRAVGALHDESARVQSEGRLRLMEKAVASANDPILITEAEPIDAPGPRIVYANDAFLKQTGYKLEEVLGETPRILQGPKTDRKALDRLKKAMQNWEPFQMETINYTKEGEEFWVEFSVVPIANEKGWCTHWLSIQRDTTERAKKSEIREVFRRMNMAVSRPKSMVERYEAVLNEMLEYTGFDAAEGWITDIDGGNLNRVCGTYRNPKFRQFLLDGNYLKQVEKGKGLAGGVWEEDKILIWENLAEHDDFIRTEAAEDNNINSSVAIPIYRDKSLVGVICLFSKQSKLHTVPFEPFLSRVSVRFGAELKRLKTEEELRTIFELTPNFLFVIDQSGIIKKANSALAKFLDVPVANCVGQSFVSNIPNEEKAVFEGFIKSLYATKQSKEIDTPINIAGELKWLNLTAVQQIGDPLIYCVGKDISEQKNLDDILLKAHRMAQLGTWELNLVKEHIYWSPETKRIHGVEEDYQPDLSTAINSYKEGAHRDLVQEYVQKAIKGEIEGWEFDSIIITGSGKEKWVRAQGQVERLNGVVTRVFGSFQDIHKRKIAESELADAVIRKDLAAKAANMGVWDWHIQDDTLIWDDVMYQLYGVDPDDFSGAYDAWQGGLHPDDKDSENQKIQKALLGEQDFNSQFRVIHPKSNEIKYIRAIAHLERNQAGDPIRMVGINYDVTEEVESQKKAEALNRERKDILESITDGFFSVNNDWIVTYWNKAAEVMLEMPRENIIGENLWKLYEDAKSLKYYDIYHQSMEQGEVKRFVEYYPAKKLWTEVACFPKENGLAVYFKNITERIEGDRELTKLKRLQEHVVNSTRDFIWAIDDEFKLILANESYVKSMKEFYNANYKIGELVLSAQESNWHANEKDKSIWMNAYKSVLNGNEEHFTHIIKNEQKEDRVFQIGFYPIREDDNNSLISGVACFAKEITERVQHMEAIEEQNKKLKEIAFIQSHVVRAPLARILGLTALIKNGVVAKNEEDDILDLIVNSSKELDEVIRNISDKTAPLKLNK